MTTIAPAALAEQIKSRPAPVFSIVNESPRVYEIKPVTKELLPHPSELYPWQERFSQYLSRLYRPRLEYQLPVTQVSIPSGGIRRDDMLWFVSETRRHTIRFDEMYFSSTRSRVHAEKTQRTRAQYLEETKQHRLPPAQNSRANVSKRLSFLQGKL